MSNPSIKFGELPPDGRQRTSKSKWTAIAAQLRERPGQWALVATMATKSTLAGGDVSGGAR